MAGELTVNRVDLVSALRVGAKIASIHSLRPWIFLLTIIKGAPSVNRVGLGGGL